VTAAGGVSATGAGRPRDASDLVLLESGSMLARRAGGAIVLLWAWQAALALVVAWPVASGVGAIYGEHPDGDRPLWEPGGFVLTHLLLKYDALLDAASAVAVTAIALGAIASLVPLAALVVSIAHATRAGHPPAPGAALARGARTFATFAALLVGATALGGLALAAARGVALATSHLLAAHHEKPLSDQLGVLAALPLATLGPFVLALQDLARVAAVRFRVGAVAAVGVALRVLRRAPVALLWSWAWRAIAGLAPVAVGVVVAGRIGGRGGWALAALFAVHQIALLGRVSLRASWLARALRAIDVGAGDRAAGAPQEPPRAPRM
jgi:hypothetical protein